MPSGQILYLMMFVGKYLCTSHVLQYSSSRSYEHSRSLQSILCPGAVTVLICSFFVVALLFVYINLKNGGKITHFFTIHQTFLHFFAYSEELTSISIILSLFLCTFALVMDRVKEAYTEKKKTLKGYYPQERWMGYGVPDKR